MFYIYSKIGPLSARDRASLINDKLLNLSGNQELDTSKFGHVLLEDNIDILYEAEIIYTINKRDAYWNGKDAGELAVQQIALLKKSLFLSNASTSLTKTLIRFGLLLLVAVVLFILVKLLNKGFSILVVKVANTGNKYMKGIKLREYEFLTPEREFQLAKWILNVLKWIVILMILSIALPVIFSIFPTTEGVARLLLGYFINPLTGMFKSFIGFIPELITITIIITLTVYVVRFLKFLTSEVRRGKLVIPGFFPEWALPTFNLVRMVVYAFSFVVIFPYLPGSDSGVFKGVSVFIGLLISLGSSSAISNIIAGLVITYMRPFKMGDRVKIGDVVGDVLEKTMLVTRVRTIKNEDISIPNSAILNGSTINYSSSARELGLILHSTVTIGYDVPWLQVHQLLIDAAAKCEFVLEDPQPFVLQTSLDDYYVSYQINAYTNKVNKAALSYSQLHANIQDCFNAAEVEIMSPHYRHMRDGNESTIPSDYVAPSPKAKDADKEEESADGTEQD